MFHLKLQKLVFGYIPAAFLILTIVLASANCKVIMKRRNAVILTTAPIQPVSLASRVTYVVKPAAAPVPMARAVAAVPQPQVVPAVQAPPQALPKGFYTIPISGSDRLKYYYTNVYVGTPPQKQSVIVDTGSDYLAFPCSNCINGKCGKHNNPALNMQTNTTAKPVKCGEKIGNFVCGKYCNKGQCAFKRSYLEGSSLKGVVYRDLIGVVAPTDHQSGNVSTKSKNPLAQKTQKFPQVEGLYGCTMSETGLFRTQLANGIMGLASKTNSKTTKPNFIDNLFSSQKSKSKNFSICLGTNGGYLTFGGYNVAKHIRNEKIQTTKYTKNYLVAIESVGVNAKPTWKFKKPV